MKIKTVLPILTALSLTSTAKAEPFSDELLFEIDAGYSLIRHSWSDTNGKTLYKSNMKEIGASIDYNGFGLRIGYGELDGLSEDTNGAYPNVAIDFEHIWSFELLYTSYINDKWRIYGGIGSYLLPVDHYYRKGDEWVFGKNDEDNDEGIFFGVKYSLTEDISVNLKVTQYSWIQDWKEYTRGASIGLSYRF